MDLSEFIQIQTRNFKRHPWELTRLKMLSHFIKQCHKANSIIDIGSGDAFLASHIARQYSASQVSAIDINYNDKLLKELKNGEPENLHFHNNIDLLAPIQNIDIVILMDVLEHIEHPGEILKRILDLPGVTSETFFIITVPAYQNLFSQHDKNLGHFRRYNLKTLQQLLQPYHLNLIRKGYCFNTLLSIRWFQLFFEKINRNKKNNSEGIHNWKRSDRMTRFITSLFWIEFKISWYLARIGIKIPGLTCYSICHPSQL